MSQQGVLLIGMGNWGKNIANTLYEIGQLSAISDSDEGRREAVQAQYPGVKFYTDYTLMLEQHQGPVVLATPVNTHFRLASELLHKGRHLLVEKPLASKPEECESLMQLAKEQGLVLMVGHLLIYQPAIVFMKSAIAEGAIGKIRSIYQYRCNLGKIRTFENALLSLGVHDLAVLDFLLEQAPERIEACGQSSITEGIEDEVFLHMHYANNIAAHLHVSWLWPTKERRMLIMGEKGGFEFNEQSQEVVFHPCYPNPDHSLHKGESKVVFKDNQPPLKLELEHFINSAQQLSEPNSPAEQAYRVALILEQAMQQLKTTG